MDVQAYAYEPELTEEELVEERERNNSGESTERIAVDVEDWCSCGNCVVMPSSDECVCCRESEYVLPNIEDFSCITQHNQFELLVLNSDVLAVAYIQIMIHKGQHGRVPDILTNRQSRLTAYRQFVCWMMRGEKLGKGKRVVIPSCVVNTIRIKFPEEDGQYTGFKTVFNSIQDLF